MPPLADCVGDGVETPWPEQAARWSQSAREVFIERLAIADDLGLDARPGSDAWNIAVREAMREAARIPIGAGQGRDSNIIDDALAVFAPSGGLKFVPVSTRVVINGTGDLIN